MNSSIRFALLALIVCVAVSQAQITLNSTDFPTSPGTTVNMGSTGSNLVTVNVGSAGANQTWNFASMTTTTTYTNNWVAPNTTPFFAEYSTANRCIQSPGATGTSYTYILLSSSSFTILGIVQISGVDTTDITYTSTQPTYPFPVTYNSWWNTVFQYVPYTGATLKDSTYSIVDGWGTLTDQAGTWPCLRVKAHTTITISFQGFPISTTTTYGYTWLVAGRGDQVNIGSGPNESNPNFTSGRFSRITGLLAVQPLPNPIVMPTTIELSPAYPNPFNPNTILTFTLPSSGDVNLTVFDASGREVSNLAQGHYLPGAYQVEFNGANLSSGTYFARLISNGFETTRSLTLLK